MNLAEYIAFAHQLAGLSGDIIRPYFRAQTGVEIKPDHSPVTHADREAEQAQRKAILERYPDHGIWGEEFGQHHIDREWVWVLDPVDGTKSFMSGFPTFGTLIALTHRHLPVLGLIHQPISGERWIGVTGHPTQFNGTVVCSHPTVTLAEATLCTTSPDLLSAEERIRFDRVRAKTRYTLYGYDCYAYAQLASGHVHAVIETGLKPHDFCALAPVINGAGGVMTDWDGNPLTMQSDGRVIAAANPTLHQQILSQL